MSRMYCDCFDLGLGRRGRQFREPIIWRLRSRCSERLFGGILRAIVNG